ncbi:MAG: ornithine cyclodeaminase family protein [candidate division Zixibacteria bacterium]|nr:ornithine cyclodeaminase family protein [candidate division Zixibacteria bacterium]
METYIISRSIIENALDMELCLASVEKAFRLYGQDKIQMPAKTFLEFPQFNGDLRNHSTYVPDLDIAGIKASSVHLDNSTFKLETVVGTIILIDPKNGFPLAILDGTYITRMRTGAAGGLAAKYLANPDIEQVGFVGAGNQARSLFEALITVHPEIKKAIVYDIKPDKAEAFARFCREHKNLEVEVVEEIDKAVTGCGIVNTCTSSRQPLFDDSVVSPGTHINAIGADAEGKQEMSSQVIKNAYLVIDSWLETSRTGEINVPFHMGEISQSDIDATLSEVILGIKTGRSSADQVTVFDSAGIAIQDIVTAWDVYQSLMQAGSDRDGLLTVDLLR